MLLNNKIVISSFKEEKVKVCNGVAVGDKFLAIISGENHCVYFLDKITHNEIKKIGHYGLKHNGFKIPVAISFNSGIFYIADWGNHRVVTIKEDSFEVNKYGRFKDFEKGKFINYIYYMKSLGINYTYRNKLINKVMKFFSIIRLENIKKILNYNKSKIYFKKPDGFAFTENSIFISQHYNHCITKCDKNLNLIQYFGKNGKQVSEFNRPSNMTIHENLLYISDSHNSRICVYDLDFNFIKYIYGVESTLENRFFPFGLKFLNENLLVICGMELIQIYNIRTDEVIETIRDDYNQLHGADIDYENNKIYFADRMNHRVVVYDIEKKGL